MLSSLAWKLRSLARRLWVRTALFAVLALVVALLAPFVTYLPFELAFRIEAESLQRLLSILTDSMLAVTTFSLSIMVSAHLTADGSATPRAHRLLREDGRTQSVIATFIGAFIYALTLTVLLSVELIGNGEVALIYLVTIGVILLVVVAILRWVAHLAGLGSVEATLDRVEQSARQSLKWRTDHPHLGARPIGTSAPIPRDASAIHARGYGYVQNVDTSGMSAKAEEHGTAIWLAVAPGDLVGKGDTLAYLSLPDLDEALAESLAACITIGQKRSYEQDPIFALTVMTEIAERALSPGINDPATAVDAITRLTDLVDGMDVERPMDSPFAPAVHAPPLDLDRLMLEVFDPIARDGRTFAEVQLAVQAAYRRLSGHREERIGAAAQALSSRALAYASDGIMLIEDLQRIAAIAPATRVAATTGEAPKESVIDALGEERQESHFTGG